MRESPIRQICMHAVLVCLSRAVPICGGESGQYTHSNAKYLGSHTKMQIVCSHQSNYYQETTSSYRADPMRKNRPLGQTRSHLYRQCSQRTDYC
ncbi:hypothetical protein V8C26DRAFT_257270 [Trichoderma gracile]